MGKAVIKGRMQADVYGSDAVEIDGGDHLYVTVFVENREMLELHVLKDGSFAMDRLGEFGRTRLIESELERVI